MKRVDIIGVNITAMNMEACINFIINKFDAARGRYICAANAHTTVYAREHNEYREIQNNSFLTLPDGKPLSVIGKRKGYFEMERITGPDFFSKILELSPNQGWKHYFYGNTDENLKLLVNYINDNYPDVDVVGYEPSVFRELSNSEEIELIRHINSSRADFVWVGLGAPRQEELCAKMSLKSNSLWVGVGGAFNVITGIIPRAPKWIQNCGLEWLYRLIHEPKRLFKRYMITNTKFMYYCIIDFFKR